MTVNLPRQLGRYLSLYGHGKWVKSCYTAILFVVC